MISKDNAFVIFCIVFIILGFWFADWADRESGCTWSIWDEFQTTEYYEGGGEQQSFDVWVKTMDMDYWDEPWHYGWRKFSFPNGAGRAYMWRHRESFKGSGE
jgi:hypothetical protein